MTLSRQAEWQRRMKRTGRCEKCGQKRGKSQSRRLCIPCHEREKERDRKRKQNGNS